MTKIIYSTLVAIALTTTAYAEDDAGKKTYDQACAACHTSGVAGAPKTGDADAWAARIEAGTEGLYTSAIKGKGAMPAKGGQVAIADDDIKAAVDYMIKASSKL